MRKVKYLPFLLFLILLACNAKITEEYLIGGYWVGTAGYEEGRPEGKPACLSLVTDGLEFIDENTAYSEGYDSVLGFQLEKQEKGVAVVFNREGTYYSYYIDWIRDRKSTRLNSSHVS